MEVYEIKRKIKQKNEWIYNILKKIGSVWSYIKRIPIKFREYKKIKKQLKTVKAEDSKVLYVGIPLHSNLGDQAQYYCISKWLSNNYSNFKVIEMPDILINSNFLNINKVIKKIINKEDIIIFQSGYRTTDVANIKGEYAHRKIIKMFSENKILVFPQTINFKSDKELEESKEAYKLGKRLLFLARDKKSYEMAKKSCVNNCVELYPDIVTSLIGTYQFNSPREGILCCMRRDGEKLYENEDIDKMMSELKKITKVDRTDTTISTKYTELKKELKSIIENTIEQFSKYKVVITDRYHGTIFSLASNTPTIVINSTDHKLSSGVDWFKDKEEFKGYIFFAQSLEEAQKLAEDIYRNKKDYKVLPEYFRTHYYDKLKEKFEEI